MDTPANTCKLILAKVSKGLTQRRIAEQLHLSQSAVARTVLRYKKAGQHQSLRYGRCGRKPLLSGKTMRYLTRESCINPRASARQIQRAVGGEAAKVSLSTIKRTLILCGRLAFRPVKSPSWTPEQMKVMLEWALKHQKWSAGRWKQVRELFHRCSEDLNLNRCFCGCAIFVFRSYFLMNHHSTWLSHVLTSSDGRLENA